MVVENAVVGGLALHELLRIGERTLTRLKLLIEHLQFAPCSLHTVSASVDRDFASRTEREPGFAEAEGLREGNDFALPFVHSDAECFKPAHHLPNYCFQLLNIRHDDVVVIHIVTGTMDTHLAFQPVIDRAGQSHHLLLRRLHTQGHPPLRRGAG